MQTLHYPLTFEFKITTLANDFSARDANGNLVAYVRQKMFKLREHIEVFSDESRTQLQYNINAASWLDFSNAYSFTDARGHGFGKVARKGWRSIWKAEYEIIDERNELQYRIREENGWVKVIDNLISEIPILGWFTGYLFNPSYLVTNLRGESMARLSKEASFWGRRFSVEKIGQLDGDDDDRLMLSLMMMVLLERERG